MHLTHIPLALLLAIPAVTLAQDRTRPPPSPRPEPADPASATAARQPRPPPDSTPSRPPPPGPVHPRPPGPGGGQGGWAPAPTIYYPPPFWSGYGWGWGYYPLYPVFVPAQDYAAAAPPRQLAATVRAAGAFGPRDTGLAGMAVTFDGRSTGFEMGFDAFQPSSGGVMNGGRSGQSSSYGFGTAHFAYPVFEGSSYRLRLEAGGSWLTVPSSAWGSSTDAFGIDLGASGQLGLFGPLGLEGHARLTPFPVQVIDLRAAAALRAGTLSVTFGYRVLDVAADSRTGPAARFEGPELGLGLIF